MHAARFSARKRQADIQSQLAIILGLKASGDEREIERIHFTQDSHFRRSAIHLPTQCAHISEQSTFCPR
jgi:hypothetical protein